MSTTPPTGITREKALELVRRYLKNERMVAHCLASEAIMRELAPKFNEDENIWGLAGLLHDLDYEEINQDEQRHGVEAERILTEHGVSPIIINAVKMHNAENLGLERSTILEHALTCAETVTGMIVAAALVYPDKKISSVKVKSVTKRMKTPHFARAVNRERIMECEKIGLPLDEFVDISLKAMTRISEQIGL